MTFSELDYYISRRKGKTHVVSLDSFEGEKFVLKRASYGTCYLFPYAKFESGCSFKYFIPDQPMNQKRARLLKLPDLKVGKLLDVKRVFHCGYEPF